MRDCTVIARIYTEENSFSPNLLRLSFPLHDAIMSQEVVKMQYNQALAHIKALKEAGHVSGHALAEKCHVTDGTMSKMLNGQATITLPVALDLAEVLGVSLSELVGEPPQTRAETVERLVSIGLSELSESVHSDESSRRAGIAALLAAALAERLR